MKKIFSKEFAIGASVIVALAILFFGIDYLKGINLFKPANFYEVSYDNVAGLEVAAPVTIDGYKVGQVREIEFNYDNPGKIKVLLALDTKLHPRKGTTARIETSMLSGASIVLTLGKGDLLPVGSELTATTSSDLMATLKDEIVPSAVGVINHVDSLILDINKVVSDPYLLQSIHRLDGISSNLLNASGTLSTTLNRQTPILFNHVNRVASNLDTITAGLGTFTSTLNDLPLQESVARLNELTSNLVAFSKQLNDQKSSLGLLMHDPELYNRLCRISADVDSLVVDIKKNPKRYISIKLL